MTAKIIKLNYYIRKVVVVKEEEEVLEMNVK